ncbi:DUF4326 domain-containing protein [Schaalia sp. ZJ405]|nr:DUF4326 domain-containing protein [Schaalia sp. ZJ405]
MPQRIQRKRSKGWRMPDCTCGQGNPHKAVYVGRGTKWGNPHVVEREHIGAWCVQGPCNEWLLSWEGFFATKTQALKHAAFLYDTGCHTCAWHDMDLTPLQGHDLACWCPPNQPCHADTLLREANT